MVKKKEEEQYTMEGLDKVFPGFMKTKVAIELATLRMKKKIAAGLDSEISVYELINDIRRDPQGILKEIEDLKVEQKEREEKELKRELFAKSEREYREPRGEGKGERDSREHREPRGDRGEPRGR